MGFCDLAVASRALPTGRGELSVLVAKRRLHCFRRWREGSAGMAGASAACRPQTVARRSNRVKGIVFRMWEVMMERS
jgi:hypothetical protein